MKKIFFYFSFSFIIFSNCSQDEVSSSETDAVIIGTTAADDISQGGSNTSGSSQPNPSYPLPPAPLFTTPKDLSSFTLSPGETGNLEVFVSSSTDHALPNYFFINTIEYTVTVEGVAQPSTSLSPNQYFPKRRYNTADDPTPKTISAGNINGKFQSLFHYKCDTSSGKNITVNLEVNYVHLVSDGFGNNTSNPHNIERNLSFKCDRRKSNPFNIAIDL